MTNSVFRVLPTLDWADGGTPCLGLPPVHDSNLEPRRALMWNSCMPNPKPLSYLAIHAVRSTLCAGYGKLTTPQLAISEVLACANLLLVGAIYGFIGGRIVGAIQFVIVPVVLLATVAFATKDFLHPKTRLHSAVALALSVPVGFMYFVWHGWILP